MDDPDADRGDTERQVRKDTDRRVEANTDNSDRKQAVVPLEDGTERGPARPTRPLEPETVDVENAVFVLLGVVLVGGLLVGAIAGL